jgi:RNA polymerase sigma factor (sigma-70 family)
MSHADRSTKSNVELAKALREGTEEGFALFYEAFAGRLSHFVARSLRDPSAASDIVHDTMISVRTNIGQLRNDEHLAAWVYAITRNRMRSHARRSSRTVLMTSIPEEAMETDFVHLVESRELVSMISTAVAGLTQRERRVYDIYVVSGVPIEGLATELGLSLDNTRKLVQRMRLRVARSVEALVLTQPGCNDCPDFQTLLSGWDGQLSPLWRKRIARHVDVCTGCEQRCGSIISMSPTFASKKVSAEARLSTLSV